MTHVHPTLDLALALLAMPLAAQTVQPEAAPCARNDFAQRSFEAEGLGINLRMPALPFNGLTLALENTLDRPVAVDLGDLQRVGLDGRQTLLAWMRTKPPFTFKLAPKARIELKAVPQGAFSYPVRIRYGTQELATVTNQPRTAPGKIEVAAHLPDESPPGIAYHGNIPMMLEERCSACLRPCASRCSPWRSCP